MVKISSILTNGQGRRLRDRYKGLYKVMEKLEGNTYMVKSIRGRQYKTIYVVEHLRTWITFSKEEGSGRKEMKVTLLLE